MSGAEPPAVFRLDTEPAPPPAITAWFALHVEDFARVRRCRHGSWHSPTVLWPGEPHRALCPACDAQRGQELRAAERALPSGAALDCDFCGVPALALRVVVLPIGPLLVRGVACPACLGVPVPTS
jgi:hypothetical protein